MCQICTGVVTSGQSHLDVTCECEHRWTMNVLNLHVWLLHVSLECRASIDEWWLSWTCMSDSYMSLLSVSLECLSDMSLLRVSLVSVSLTCLSWVSLLHVYPICLSCACAWNTCPNALERNIFLFLGRPWSEGWFRKCNPLGPWASCIDCNQYSANHIDIVFPERVWAQGSSNSGGL